MLADSTFIPVYRGTGEIVAYTLIDRADLPLIGPNHWLLLSMGYAYQWALVDGKRACLLMHRVLTDLQAGDGLEADHKNRNRLDNRRFNLRVLTRAQNRQNLGKRRGSQSIYRGVIWDESRGLWQARAANRFFGRYATQEEAATVAADARRKLLPYSEN